MEYEKTTYFLGNITNQPYKFRTKNLVEIMMIHMEQKHE